MAPASKNFGPQNFGAVPRTSAHDQGASEDDRRLLRFSNGFCSVRVFDDSTARRSAAAASREHRPGASRAGWRLRQSHHRLQRSLQPGMTLVPITFFKPQNRGAVIQALPRGQLTQE